MKDYELIEDLYKNNKLVNCDTFVQTLKIGDPAPIVKHKITSQMTYVLKGHGAAIIDGKLIKINQGQRIDIKQNQTHSFFAIKEDLLLFHVHVPFFTVEEDRYVLEKDINIDRKSNPMSNVIIWDDMKLFGKKNNIINNLKKIESICSYYYVNDEQLNEWKNKAKGDFIIAIGKRPNLICKPDISIMPSRNKNEDGICQYVILSDEDKVKIRQIDKSTEKITIVEDFVVEGKTMHKILNEIRKNNNAKIEIVILGGLNQTISEIENSFDYVKMFVCGPTIDGKPIEDATILFISDLLNNNRKMLMNKKLMIRCFIDCYESVIEIIK